MRKYLAARQWEEIRAECHQIAVGSTKFAFGEIGTLALLAEESIPPGKISRAAVLPDARQAVETLIATIDQMASAEAAARN